MIVSPNEVIIPNGEKNIRIPRAFACDDIIIDGNTYIILSNLETDSEDSEYVYYKALRRNDLALCRLAYWKSNAGHWKVNHPDRIYVVGRADEYQ